MKEVQEQITEAVNGLKGENNTCIYLDSTGHIIARLDKMSLICFTAAMLDKLEEELGKTGFEMVKMMRENMEEE